VCSTGKGIQIFLAQVGLRQLEYRQPHHHPQTQYPVNRGSLSANQHVEKTGHQIEYVDLQSKSKKQLLANAEKTKNNYGWSEHVVSTNTTF
jgi:hypothetical protein